MKKLSNITIGKLLGVFHHFDYYSACESPTEDDHCVFDSYPDFYSNANQENMQKIKEFSKSLKWEYEYL